MHDVGGDPRHRGDDGQDDEVARHGRRGRAGDGKAEQGLGRHFDRPGVVIVDEPGHAGEAPFEKELRRQRRHRQIEPLDAQAGQAEHDADKRRDQPAHDDPDDDVHLREHRLELVAGIGPHAHECAGSKRQEARISRQQVEPDRAQRENQERDHHGVQEKLVAERGDDHEGDEEDKCQAVAVLADREDRHVGRIGRLVLTGFAIEHGKRFLERVAMR